MEKEKLSDSVKEEEKREEMEEKREAREEKREVREEHREVENMLPVIAIIISVVAILLSSYSILRPVTGVNVTTTVPSNLTTSITVSGYNIKSALLEPASALSDSPVITKNQTFGTRLTNINAPFNASELGIINDVPNSYFETAGEMYLNRTLNNSVGGAVPKKLSLFIVNGKPTVIYLGSTTCIFCAENRWAMAMALSRFGNFSMLFKGYSALQDGDLPSIFWAPTHYNSSSTEAGDFYNSSYINFIAIEDGNPISGGFSLNPIPTIASRINSTKNLAYIDALAYLLSTGDLRGTPFTVWGAYEVGGVDAVVLGNSTPTSNTYPLTYMTHEQVLEQFANPKDQFAWSEYAAADIYVAMVCKTLGNKAPVCKLPAIVSIESQLGS
ncbi:MAG: DUF929 family protein [Candidatus Micrarchaeales archaeon]|jgi:hypothetical protein